ncbi:uncharacterized protein TRAVEDRAFT_48122 [Trametes versicolor FP-101664 SS1]|uniref:uncharacterized protein n=1 Tax=Trametes versicolor (strain FP-101664) TaxID=717944 RepID=UPI0004622D5B|nr:uncharacterized protein TRAVEDRAFT_48122 [Trametes versicolor FP-101664 SS1]EIW58991.1 hypothetical protein TRAVEDRAFT_48122 [Trametes versicolor FP-101664 SS1]
MAVRVLLLGDDVLPSSSPVAHRSLYLTYPSAGSPPALSSSALGLSHDAPLLNSPTPTPHTSTHRSPPHTHVMDAVAGFEDRRGFCGELMQDIRGGCVLRAPYAGKRCPREVYLWGTSSAGAPSAQAITNAP